MTKRLNFDKVKQKIKTKMSERPPIPTTNSEQELISVGEYEGVFTIGESPVDQQGYARPIFKLEGFDDSVVFVRPRKELPKFENTNIDEKGHVITESGEFSIVEVTPAGLLKKAIEHNPDNEKLQEILVNIENQDYGDEELLLLDTIAAAVAIDESGEITTTAQTEGFALVISALVGNPKAKEILEKKLEAYYKYSSEMSQKKSSELKEKYYQLKLETERAELEPLDWSDLAFVHSTEYDVVRNENGEVILRPRSHYNLNSETPNARATLHFATNAEVASHHRGTWERSNKLIVVNGQTMVNDNGLPAAMHTVDTFWSLNPGQELVLRDAIVVEPAENLPKLILEDKEKKIVKYLDKESYTDEERLELYCLLTGQAYDKADLEKIKDKIDALRGKESANLRRIALNKAMEQQGIEQKPLNINEYSSTDSKFDYRYELFAFEQGITHSLHQDTSEYAIEKSASDDDPTVSRLKNTSPPSHVKGELQAVRTWVAEGFIRPRVIDRRHRNEDKSIA